MPPETESDAQTSAPRIWAPSEPHLFVVLEGDRPLAGGMRCALAEIDEVLIGRTDARSVTRDRAARRLVLGLPDRKISTRHARLVREGSTWRFEDLGSTNGSFLGGKRVTQERLADGALVDVGRTVLRFRASLPTPADTRADSDPSEREATMGLATLLPALAGELRVVARMASSKVPVLLLGETGTGKEIAARAIHASSKRAGAFVAVNCAALPDTLVEAQLFGHVKGAFSGATRDEPGFVRSADGGTLFLDEIGDLPRAAQGVLLRVLQEGEVVPVGSTRPVKVDVRVVAATHQPIDAMIRRGEFRSDLFARLQGFTHRLWRLGDRREDVGALVAELLPQIAGAKAESLRITVEAARALAEYAWPLNVRELSQSLSRAVTLTAGEPIELAHLGLAHPTTATDATLAPKGTPAGVPGELTPEDEALRRSLIDHLRRCEGNVAAVAREMSKAPMQVYRWMRRLEIDPKTYR
ncbi:MAG TPA: sigma 54-interacting transcriptional regulator [Polyangiaceae bacterium]|jgi:DNA-binding NtrC family response regulator